MPPQTSSRTAPPGISTLYLKASLLAALAVRAALPHCHRAAKIYSRFAKRYVTGGALPLPLPLQSEKLYCAASLLSRPFDFSWVEAKGEVKHVCARER